MNNVFKWWSYKEHTPHLDVARGLFRLKMDNRIDNLVKEVRTCAFSGHPQVTFLDKELDKNYEHSKGLFLVWVISEALNRESLIFKLELESEEWTPEPFFAEPISIELHKIFTLVVDCAQYQFENLGERDGYERVNEWLFDWFYEFYEKADLNRIYNVPIRLWNKLGFQFEYYRRKVLCYGN